MTYLATIAKVNICTSTTTAHKSSVHSQRALNRLEISPLLAAINCDCYAHVLWLHGALHAVCLAHVSHILYVNVLHVTIFLYNPHSPVYKVAQSA